MKAEAFHLIGVGGAGMSVVAELLCARGYRVSGSDQADSASLRRVGESGAQVWVGHDPDRVDPDAVIVRSSAIRDFDPELAAARARGQRVIHRSQALALAASDRDFIAVAGTHGKTTTSGMLAAALSAAGTDPSYAVGAVVVGFPSGAHLGTGSTFVAEADESDGSFLNYTPHIAIVTNIEPDHLDHYGSVEAFEQAFSDFVDRLDPQGTLVACADDPGSRRLARSAAATHRVLTYGTSEPPEGVSEHVRVTSVVASAASSSVALELADGTSTTLQVPVPGHHNVLNAVAALIAGTLVGVEHQTMARALAAFRGTGRRFQMRGEEAGVRVIDDYAHHPTEVRALLEQARVAADGGRVLVVFQPHLYSRTLTFAADFAQALAGADEAVVTAIFGAREDPVPGVTSDLIVARNRSLRSIPDAAEAGRWVASRACPGDLVLTVGAGSITEVAPLILDELRRGHHG